MRVLLWQTPITFPVYHQHLVATSNFYLFSKLMIVVMVTTAKLMHYDMWYWKCPLTASNIWHWSIQYTVCDIIGCLWKQQLISSKCCRTACGEFVPGATAQELISQRMCWDWCVLQKIITVRKLMRSHTNIIFVFVYIHVQTVYNSCI